MVAHRIPAVVVSGIARIVSVAYPELLSPQENIGMRGRGRGRGEGPGKEKGRIPEQGEDKN